MSKTIFITGASTGLGKATAQLFATKGILRCRYIPGNHLIIKLLYKIAKTINSIYEIIDAVRYKK